MADPKTLQRAGKIITRIDRILEPFGPESVIVLGQEQRLPHKFYKAHVKQMRKGAPGLKTKIYGMLPKKMMRKFMVWTPGEPTPKPTKSEYAEFERKLLAATRTVIGEEIKKRLATLPKYKHTSREERIKVTCKTVKAFRKEGLPETKAVREAAKFLGKHEQTVWLHLRLNARRARLA